MGRQIFRWPDIVGEATHAMGQDSSFVPIVKESGALYAVSQTDTALIRGTTTESNSRVSLGIKASKANAIYRGDTFQTNALRLLAIVKYWALTLQVTYIHSTQQAEMKSRAER